MTITVETQIGLFDAFEIAKFGILKGQNQGIASNLLDYGCWCRLRNFEAGGIVKGHGAPVDALDSACKAWHQCRKCTSVDFKSCDPNDIDYEVGFDIQSQRISCEFNSSQCSVSLEMMDSDG